MSDEGFALFVEGFDWDVLTALVSVFSAAFFFAAPNEDVPSVANKKEVASRERNSVFNFIEWAILA